MLDEICSFHMQFYSNWTDILPEWQVDNSINQANKWKTKMNFM